MKILILHDRLEVAQTIKDKCQNICECDIDIVEDAVSCKRKLAEKLYDLLIADLTIPHRKPGPIDYSNAINLLSDIYIDETYPPADVIAITKDELACQTVIEQTAKDINILKIVLETETGDWLEKIRQTIVYLKRAAESRSRALAAHHEIDVLMLCAMDEEFIPIQESLTLTAVRGFPHVYQFVFNDRNGHPRRGIAASIGKQGQEASASFTQSLLSWYRPKLVVMSGICGGVTDRVELGDVVFFESVISWDAGKYKTDSDSNTPIWLRARPDTLSIENSRAHSIARRLVMDWQKNGNAMRTQIAQKSLGKINNCNLLLKIGASGSSVVAAGEIVSKIRQLNDNVHAIDMEAYGLYFAAERTLVAKPEFICVKSVSDFCDAAKGDDFHSAAAWASWLVAQQFMLEWEHY